MIIDIIPQFAGCACLNLANNSRKGLVTGGPHILEHISMLKFFFVCCGEERGE